jgi:hypothetical protein
MMPHAFHILRRHHRSPIAAVAWCGILLAACSPLRPPAEDHAPADARSQPGQTHAIKNLIATLEPFSYHECSIEDAAAWLDQVTVERAWFQGALCESVVFPGDGCAGRTRFYLDSSGGKFWEHSFAWEPGSSDRLHEYDVVNGGLSFITSRATSPPIPDQ